MPAPLGPMTPDDAAGRQLERQVVDEQAIAERLLQPLELDDVLAQPFRHRDDDLGDRGHALLALGDEILVALDAGLRLRLAGLGRGGDPLAFLLQGALARLVLAAFLQQALLLLLQPGRVVALVGDAAAAVEFEDPARDVVEEVAVMGHDEDGARVGAQVTFEPRHGLGIEMVGGLVEEQHLGLLEQELAQRHAAALAARQAVDVGILGRAAERVHRLVDLGVEVPQVLRLDLVLQGRHLVGGLVRIVHGEFVVPVEDRLLLGDAEHDVAAHAERRLEMRLLRQVADPGALGHEALAGEVGVDARHDAQQRRLARAVDAQHADLGGRIERQVDVVQHLLAAGVGLGQALHVIDELIGCHGRWAVARVRIRGWRDR